MSAVPNRDRTVAALIDKVRSKGGRLWLEDGELRYRAPKGALDSEEMRRLGASKKIIVDYLERVSDSAPEEMGLVARRPDEPVPLTYSQLKYWNSRRLWEQPSVRTVASALRLLGPLDLKLLERSVTFLVERHEALRTRIVAVDGAPCQVIQRSAEQAFQVEDLSADRSRQSDENIQQLIRSVVLRPMQVTRGPLFTAHVAKLGEADHLLIVAMEHIISDAFSLNLLLRELREVYAQLSEGRAPCLPELPVQYADYAVWLSKSREAWMARHGQYWQQRLQDSARLRFPDARCENMTDRGALAAHPISFPQNARARLSAWCRTRRTTLAMSLFTAYAASVLRWCNATDAVFPFQTDGRHNPKLQNAIGYCATVLHLRVQMHGSDTFTELLERVTKEYCAACEHADHNYVAAQMPRPEYTRNSSFNLIPHGLEGGASIWTTAQGDIACRRIAFPHPARESYGLDVEPMVLLIDTAEGISGNLYYPLHKFLPEQMERFAGHFIAFVECMLDEPDRQIGRIAI